MNRLTSMDMYDLCNEKQWFTCGTNSQYEKMFDYVRENNITIHYDYEIKELASMIWICSDDKFTLEDIFKGIKQKIADKYGYYL